MSSYHFSIYYDDTDFTGVMYHGNYIKYFERARSDLLHQKKISHTDLLHKHKCLFVVKSIEIEYMRPATLEDSCTILSIPSTEGIRLYFDQTMKRDDDTLCKAKVEVITVDQKFRPIPVPKNIREVLV